MSASTFRNRDSARSLETRERILSTTENFLVQNGLDLSIRAVTEEAGANVAAVNYHFGSKEGLIEAVLEREGSTWREWFSAEVDALPGSASDRLVHLFDVLKKWFAEENFYGCPFINAVGEHDKEDDRIRLLTLKHKKIVLGKITELARDARPDDPDGLTHELNLLIDGAIVAALITRDPNVADHGRNAAARLMANG